MHKREVVEAIKSYVRAANYISAIQVYLKDNFLLERELKADDIKPRLLGHWGTCPGINFVYANLNNLTNKYKLNLMFVLGPGHGFPALQANLFIEGTLKEFYKEAQINKKGLSYISKNFSWPGGFPSHSNPGAPGVILEGGELGYSLSTSYGAVLDNPDLIVACLIGDGEAETGATATAWHLNKLVDPISNGIVLPILHLNGYKISGPTIYGRMGDKELKELFSGYGYECFIVEEPNIYESMIDTLETCYKKIKDIKNSKNAFNKLPMIILRSPKGWTGIKQLHGEKLEDNCLSHQVIAKDARINKDDLLALETWFRSYKFNSLFDLKKGFNKEINSIIPKNKIGMNKHTYAWKNYKKLKLPSVTKFYHRLNRPGANNSSSMIKSGEYLSEVFKLNKNFRLFSPDETYSNKLDAVFKNTKRSFLLPLEKWDRDFARNGKVIEMLSEHSLQGLAQGYVLTGRHSIFASYEAFIEVVSSMADQYEKFLRVSRKIKWRKDIPSFNYILTSSGWRQEHNGFSHQNPKFITGMLEKPLGLSKVYFPADANTSLLVLQECLKSKNRINIIVAGKTNEFNWLDLGLATKELKKGLMIWDFASDNNPDVVFCSIGDYLTKEALAAISYLKTIAPDVRIRLVNILELSSIGIGNKSKLSLKEFEYYFTKDKPVIFNYHGYPNDIKSMLFNYKNLDRFFVNGYIEHGSTTTPFDMHVMNKTDRFNLVINALELLVKSGKLKKEDSDRLIEIFKEKLRKHHQYIIENGIDMDEIIDWKWKKY